MAQTRAAEEAVSPAPAPWWGNGSAHLRWENAGESHNGQFSALVPLHGTLGEEGTLSGSLFFAEPYGQWYEGGASQAGIGAGFRHLFGRQPVSALHEVPTKAPGFLDEGIYLGANVFFNHAETPAGQDFSQMMFTAEAGTRWLELRGRYHLPLDDGEINRRREVSRLTRQTKYQDLSVTETLVIDSTMTLLTESLRGWQVDATLLVPGVDRWVDLRVVGGYAAFDTPGVGQSELTSWRAGVDFRPVPAVVLSAMWLENEQLFGDSWLFGVGIEAPFETRNLGDGRGGFWRQIKQSFQPRRRHLAERMIEPARRHSLPMQFSTSVKSVRTTGTYSATIILPDGRVVSFKDSQTLSQNGASAQAAGSALSGSAVGSVSAGTSINTLASGNNTLGSFHSGGAVSIASLGASVQMFAPATDRSTIDYFAVPRYMGGAAAVSSSIVNVDPPRFFMGTPGQTLGTTTQENP